MRSPTFERARNPLIGTTLPSSYRVSLAFTRLSDGALPPFTTNVLNSFTGNPKFPTPPFPLPEFDAAISDFVLKLAAAEDGTRRDTVEKNNARQVLKTKTKQLAAYVQSLAGEDLAMLLSSGFEPVSTNRAQFPLEKPIIETVENSASTQLALRLKPVDTARAFEVRISIGDGSWQGVGVFTQARRIVLTGLTPGAVYSIQVRAIGGSTGASEWSDAVSHMSL
ncbi:MAG: hypothetical protein ACTHLW_11915 [Verrucomicrobiota bacterium]